MDEISAAVQAGLQYLKHIDILVNNTGIGAPNPAERVTEEDFDETQVVNLKGTFFTAQCVSKGMIQQQYGRIINLSSQAGFVALPTESVYCMTKAGGLHDTGCTIHGVSNHSIRIRTKYIFKKEGRMSEKPKTSIEEQDQKLIQRQKDQQILEQKQTQDRKPQVQEQQQLEKQQEQERKQRQQEQKLLEQHLEEKRKQRQKDQQELEAQQKRKHQQG